MRLNIDLFLSESDNKQTTKIDLEKWRLFCFLTWVTYFSERIGPGAHVYQIWCLYHQVKDFQ